MSAFLGGGRVFKEIKANSFGFQRLELVRKAIAKKHCGSKVGKELYVIDCVGRRPRAWLGIAACLTRGHCQEARFYFAPKGRTFTIQELCQLRGLPASLSLDAQRLAISGKHLAAMVGNAIPVPVLRILMGRALHVLLGCFSMRAPAQTHDASA